MGKVIEFEFRQSDRGRWCVRCDEPFPEGTAMCPRCGGDLSSAARHRAEVQARARKSARRVVATGAGLVLMLVALAVWLIIGVRVARGDEKPADKPADKATVEKPEKPVAEKPTADKPAAEKPAAEKPARAERKPKAGDKTAKADKTARPAGEAAVPLDNVESTLSPRPVRVRLLDGSTVVGSVHAEEPSTLVIDCSLGQLAIPRNRISTIAYDSAAGIGQKHAPVQQLDDEDKPTKKRAAQP